MSICLVFVALLFCQYVFIVWIWKLLKDSIWYGKKESESIRITNVWSTFNQLENLLLPCLFIVCVNKFFVCIWCAWHVRYVWALSALKGWWIIMLAMHKRPKSNKKMFKGNFIATHFCYCFSCCFSFSIYSLNIRLHIYWLLLLTTMLLLGVCRKQCLTL